MNDELNELLRAWEPKTYTAADIRAGVWRRIEHAEPSGWAAALESVIAVITRPALATGVVAFAILAGVALGSIETETAQTEAYLNAVNVFQVRQ